MLTEPHHKKRGAIEMEMILEEGRRLRPLLSPDEWREKQKELTQRAGVILHRTKQMLEAENAAMDDELAQGKQETPHELAIKLAGLIKQEMATERNAASAAIAFSSFSFKDHSECSDSKEILGTKALGFDIIKANFLQVFSILHTMPSVFKTFTSPVLSRQDSKLVVTMLARTPADRRTLETSIHKVVKSVHADRKTVSGHTSKRTAGASKGAR